jgi:hypothetical protein
VFRHAIVCFGVCLPLSFPRYTSGSKAHISTFRVVSDDTQRIHDSTQIVLLSIAGACLPSFVFWVQRQEKRGKPALIPNSLWKELAFSSICIMVFLTWAIVHSLEYLFSLLYVTTTPDRMLSVANVTDSFQEVQGLSAVETSVRFIPNVVIGIVQTLAIGLVLHRTSVYCVVLISCLLTALSPLLMALNDPDWTYWYAGFWAVLLSPISGDSECILPQLSILLGLHKPSLYGWLTYFSNDSFICCFSTHYHSHLSRQHSRSGWCRLQHAFSVWCLSGLGFRFSHILNRREAISCSSRSPSRVSCVLLDASWRRYLHMSSRRFWTKAHV